MFLAAKGDSVTIVAFLTALFATIETVVHVAMTIVITNVHYSFFFFFFLSLFFFSFLYLDWIGSGQKLEHTKETAKQSSFWTLLYSISKISLVFRIQGCVLFWPLAKTVFAVLYIISRVFVLLSIFALADLTLFFSLCCICFAQ